MSIYVSFLRLGTNFIDFYNGKELNIINVHGKH